jgi:diadenosine tetraphosphate (Ap4A) HIT family hydrolase
MSKWSNPSEWSKLVSGESCVICQQERPFDTIAELETSWVTMGEGAVLRGYCCLVFRRHAVELHDLSGEEAAAFMRDVQRLSRAIQSSTGAVKMNYEVHGNTIPHLHMHFFPRHVGDPFEGAPINPRRVTGPVYAPGAFEELKQRILRALAESHRPA